MATFFSQYPKISYPFTFGDNTIYKQVVDITTNVRIDQQALDNVINYNYTVVQNGSTPEVISYDNYETPYNHHLIILANDKEDWRESTPLTSAEFESYIKEKYVNPYGIHHFEDPDGNEIDNLYYDDSSTGNGDISYPQNVIPVTNYEYESRLNEAKRNVRVVRPELTEIVNQMIKQKINNGNE